MQKVLAVLSLNPDYVQFAIPELKSLLGKIDVPLSELFSESNPLPSKDSMIDHTNVKNFPYVTLTVPNFKENRKYFEEAARKAVMVSKFVLIISEGKNYDELIKNFNEEIVTAECRSWDDTISCDFQSRNRSIPRDLQQKNIHRILKQMDIRGKIDIKNAQKRFQLLEDHHWYRGHHESECDQTLERVYFGIELSNCREGKAKFNTKYELGKRIYLGPTSADNDLAFMMCNQADISPGSLVFDPFVGTAGLLIPPASMGAITFGSDLDTRVLNGYSVGRINKKSPFYAPEKNLEVFTPKIFLNFDQYGFIRPSIFRMDVINPCFRTTQFFDAIICDPPYGIRAMSRTVNKASDKKQVNVEKQGNQKKQEKSPEKIQTEKESTEQKTESEEDARILEAKIQAEKKLKIPEEKAGENKEISMEELDKELKKQQKKLFKKENRKKRQELIPQQEKLFKAELAKKMAAERVKNWQKFDRTKIQTTEREHIFEGLLTVARRYLKTGGRLVFLYPSYEDEEFKGVESLPKHEGFQFIDLSVNKLAKGNSRVLVTLQKSLHLAL